MRAGPLSGYSCALLGMITTLKINYAQLHVSSCLARDLKCLAFRDNK